MNVKLVSYSKPSDEFLEEGLGNVQDLIAFCAKVSNPTAQINMETSERLIKYLIKHQHWSPLEMVNAVLEINTTRDIAHQIVRHRSFAFQEFSQRYANPAEMGEMFITREARLQDKTNRHATNTQGFDLHFPEYETHFDVSFESALKKNTNADCSEINILQFIEWTITHLDWIKKTASNNE